MVVVGSPAATIFITNCNKLITIIRIEAERPMFFKNRNSQINSQATTSKECIDEKTLNSISCCIGAFYVLLTFIPVLLFIFNAFHKINNSIECKVNCSADCSVCGFVCSFVDDVGINFDVYIFACAFIYAIILFVYDFNIRLVCFKSKKVECKEIYDDLKDNIVYMYVSSVFAIVCLFISTCFPLNYVIKIVISLILLAGGCCLGVKVKSYNNKYALTKIDIDYMPTANKYSKIRKHVKESELLVTKKSCLKYYKVMETNYLIILVFLVFVASILGVDSIKLLQSIASR